MPLVFADPTDAAIPLHAVDEEGLESWISDQPPAVAAWIKAQGFTGAQGQAVTVADAEGALALAAVGLGTAKSRQGPRNFPRGSTALPPAAAPTGWRVRRWAGFWQATGFSATGIRPAWQRNWSPPMRWTQAGQRPSRPERR